VRLQPRCVAIGHAVLCQVSPKLVLLVNPTEDQIEYGEAQAVAVFRVPD
jgi:hypothetical protein